MPENILEKVISEHLVEGKLEPGEPIGYRIDQVLLQDATGTMAWMEFEQLEVDRVEVPLVVQYVDHNMIQLDHKNPDDHFFLQTCAARYGAVFSRPGNGISHYVHLERFDKPYATLVGSDSHTTTGGAMGMAALGIGGMDAAVAMAVAASDGTGPRSAVSNAGMHGCAHSAQGARAGAAPGEGPSASTTTTARSANHGP